MYWRRRMTTFIKLLGELDKDGAVLSKVDRVRCGHIDDDIFEVTPDSLYRIPGSPFAYWVSNSIRNLFRDLPSFQSDHLMAKAGLTTSDDFRFLRLDWECPPNSNTSSWINMTKGGSYSPYYADVILRLLWDNNGSEVKAFAETTPGTTHWSRNIRSPDFYFQPGLTWTQRTTSSLSFRIMPEGCIFGCKGPAVFSSRDANSMLPILAIVNSIAFKYLVGVQLAAGDAAARSYDVGVIQRTPLPIISNDEKTRLGDLALKAWSLRRNLDFINEPSHNFLLPKLLMEKLLNFDRELIIKEVTRIQSAVNIIVFDLYHFEEDDRKAAFAEVETIDKDTLETSAKSKLKDIESLLSWSVGVAFGRFEWRFTSGELEIPPDPKPFDPLPTKSPGMLSDEDQAFHDNPGILVDDSGHRHDLVRLIESVLEKVNVTVTTDARYWLRRDFFKDHLQQYSKSRRKAPIYWPLSTPSGSYTLWVYYQSLTDQTLYTAVNDFIEPKLKEVVHSAQVLGGKSDRSTQEETELARLQDLHLELEEFRATILAIAKDYVPNYDDGVQITAAPLAELFLYKPWQKLLKDTWKRLEKGDYDWAHLAMNYWPDRVREKCKSDKSLAIAHGLEELFEE
jgi:hypothetical protein